MHNVAALWRPLVFEALIAWMVDWVDFILEPTGFCHYPQVESSTSGFTPSGGGSSVSMVSVQVVFFCLFVFMRFFGHLLLGLSNI